MLRRLRTSHFSPSTPLKYISARPSSSSILTTVASSSLAPSHPHWPLQLSPTVHSKHSYQDSLPCLILWPYHHSHTFFESLYRLSPFYCITFKLFFPLSSGPFPAQPLPAYLLLSLIPSFLCLLLSSSDTQRDDSVVLYFCKWGHASFHSWNAFLRPIHQLTPLSSSKSPPSTPTLSAIPLEIWPLKRGWGAIGYSWSVLIYHLRIDMYIKKWSIFWLYHWVYLPASTVSSWAEGLCLHLFIWLVTQWDLKLDWSL